ISAENARLVLTGRRRPGAERGVVLGCPDPAKRARGVVRDDRLRRLTRTERRITGLAIPRRVEARDPRWHAGRRRNSWSNAGRALGRNSDARLLARPA